tara:strand:- start:421 stop:1176 length:756 start_codon:yes stop_codon:yes gene_type:complete
MLLLNKAKKYIINTTKREALVYKVGIAVRFKLGKLINFRNYIGLKKRIENEINSQSPGNVKIQFGAGSGKLGEASFHKIDGFIGTDILGDIPIDITKRLPIRDESINTIFSSHLIEHIHQFEIEKFLKECFRVLSKRGILITATPSLEKISKLLYGTNNPDKNFYMNSHPNSLLGRTPTPARIINCMSHINYGHKFLLDYDTYEDLSFKAGFQKVEKLDVLDIQDTSLLQFLTNRGKKYWLATELWMSTKN